MGGIGRYTAELCSRLQSCSRVEELRFYRHGRWIADVNALFGDTEVLEPRPKYMPRLWRRRSLSHRYRNFLFHGTNFFLPRHARRGIVTVHDLSVLRYPECHPEDRIRAFEREFTGSLRRAAHVVTPSETIRREVIDCFNLADSSVTAVPLAAGEGYRPRHEEDVRAALDRFGLVYGSYGLSVATIEPRKKLAQSLSAWEQLPSKLRRRFPLVIVGGEGWVNGPIRAKIAKGVSEEWVRDLGYVSESELPLVYSGARLLLYPSKYEGFGLPAVEAMASGVPCLVANGSCLVEVTQGAALLVEPDDVDQYARDIELALTDDSWRERASRNGIVVARGYSWERCVSETVDIYENVMGT